MTFHAKQERVRDARAAVARHDTAEAFLPDPSGKRGPSARTDGDSFAEEYLASALTGEDAALEAQDEVIEEEWGGPFLELDAEPGDAADPIPEPPAFHKLPPRFH
jgi:hypothetical protein